MLPTGINRTAPPVVAASVDALPAAPVAASCLPAYLNQNLGTAHAQYSPAANALRTSLETAARLANIAKAESTTPVQKMKMLESKSELKPGDILLFKPDAENITDRQWQIQQGQRLSGLSALRWNTGDRHLTHACIWTKSNKHEGATEVQGMGEPEIVEAVMQNQFLVRGSAIQAGLYKVYRPKDENLGDWAAQIGMRWADERNIKYSLDNAMKSVVRLSTFGPEAKKRAQEYEKQAFDADPEWGKSTPTFCSHTVIAMLQAAHGRISRARGEEPFSTPPAGVLGCDARNTSPRTLDYFLHNDDAFEEVGYIRIKPEDVLYSEMPPQANEPSLTDLQARAESDAR